MNLSCKSIPVILKRVVVGSMATLFISFSYQPAVLQCFCCLSPSRKRGSRNNYTNLMLHCSLSPEEIEVEKRKYECPMGIRTHYKSLLSAWFLVNYPKLTGSIFSHATFAKAKGNETVLMLTTTVIYHSETS